jgi:hypothetical protein
MRLASGVRAPAWWLTAVREKPPATGNPPKNPAATFDAPVATSSWLASMRSRVRRAIAFATLTPSA